MESAPIQSRSVYMGTKRTTTTSTEVDYLKNSTQASELQHLSDNCVANHAGNGFINGSKLQGNATKENITNGL